MHIFLCTLLVCYRLFQSDVSCHAMEAAHVNTGPALEAALPSSLLHGEMEGGCWVPETWDLPESTAGLTSPTPLPHPSLKAKKKKKVWKVHGVLCSVAVSRGFLLWVSLAFTGYANISTFSFYCTWGGWITRSLLNPAESCLNFTGMFE